MRRGSGWTARLGRLGALGLTLGAALGAGSGLAPAAPAGPEPAGQEVVVEIGNVPDAAGTVRAALCTRETFLESGCPYSGRTPAAAGTTRVVLHGVAPGTYAVEAYQDRNGNGRLDTNFLGIPTEPIGFGNNPHLQFSPPGFDEAAVTVPDRPVTIRLDLITE